MMTKYERIALIISLILCFCVAAFSFISNFFLTKEVVQDEIEYKNNYKVLLNIHRNHRDSLVAGYNYHLAETFASENDVEIEISLAHRHHFSLLDSLDIYDLVMMPRVDTTALSYPCIAVDSLSFWYFSDENEANRVSAWLENYYRSDSYEPTRKLFIRVFNPYRSRIRENLSPYDDIIKEYADSLGWDWRRLAAVIYHESRFHIEARSRRGARGLMQFMPRTARLYGLKDMLNPRENIEAGYRLFSDLENNYRNYEITEAEKSNFVLAAYNAGIGRMKDIINFADSKGVSTSSWDSLKTVIPLMNDPETIDTNIVKFGVFNGQETIEYVDSINNLYSEFQKIVK